MPQYINLVLNFSPVFSCQGHISVTLQVFNRYGERERNEIESIWAPKYCFLLFFIKGWLPSLQFSLTLCRLETWSESVSTQALPPFPWVNKPPSQEIITEYILSHRLNPCLGKWAVFCMVWFYRSPEFWQQLIFSASLPLCMKSLQIKITPLM